MEVRVSLEDQAHGIHIDLAEMTENARCRSKRELVRLIERRQEELVDELCGPRYSRSHTYRRGGSYTKTLITGLGMVRFRVKRVIRRIDDTVRSPILEALDVKRSRNRRPFYTFIGRDAIGAVRTYLRGRTETSCEQIFLTQFRNPVSYRSLYGYWMLKMKRLGLIETKGPSRGNRYGKNLHEMRDLFRSRWRPSGVDVEVAEFFMGHDIDRLGYDKSPKLYPEWFEDQYRKAEPWLNIVSEDPERVPARDHRRLQREMLELSKVVKEAEWLLGDPETAQILRNFIEERKTRPIRGIGSPYP